MNNIPLNDVIAAVKAKSPNIKASVVDHTVCLSVDGRVVASSSNAEDAWRFVYGTLALEERALAVVCPKCHSLVGVSCDEPSLDYSKVSPHPERIARLQSLESGSSSSSTATGIEDLLVKSRHGTPESHMAPPMSYADINFLLHEAEKRGAERGFNACREMAAKAACDYCRMEIPFSREDDFKDRFHNVATDGTLDYRICTSYAIRNPKPEGK